MEHELRTREVWWFFILDFTPDEVAAAHEFLERRLGYSVEIRTPT